MGFLEDRDLAGVPTIPEFYIGKTIFITGGSGFMGKVLIEKLLYSCSDLDRIYLLMRTKKGVRSEDRLQDLYSTQCFDRLKREKPGIFESKVFVIGGDIMEQGLGLSQEDRALLVNRTNIIFHVAASVRFDDSLPFAVRLNLRGTKEIVDLAKEVRDLSALVHISTSYSNTNRPIIEEIMYPPHADWRETLRICEELDEHDIRILTPKLDENAFICLSGCLYDYPDVLVYKSHFSTDTHEILYLGDIPNTYTFTKQLAEHVVYEQRGQLPVVIIRPSIVIASVEEPMPGWLENFNGPVGILVACGKGIMRSIYSDPSLIADYIPVDVAIKNFIAASWIRGTKKLEKTDDVTIYNCCASNLNNITMGELVKLGMKIAQSYPLNDMLWNAGGSITTSKTLHYFRVLILHLLPAMFVDFLLWLMGKKPKLVKIQRRIYIANEALRYYVTQQWTFENKNFIHVRSRIKEEDKEKFYYEIENVDKFGYFKDCCIGGRRYLLKEKDEDLPKAKAHLRRMVILDTFVQCIFYGYLFWWFVNSTFFARIVEYLLNLF